MGVAVAVVETAAEAAALAEALADRRAWPAPAHYARGAAAWLPRGDFGPAALEARCAGDARLRALRVTAQTSTSTFTGDEVRRRDVDAKLSSVLSLNAAGGARDHWLRSAAGGAALFLAQAPLVAVRGGVRSRAPLADLFGAGARLAPALAEKSPVGAASHLWLSPNATSSAYHYDDDHNVLGVLHGSKAVWLMAPAAGRDALFPRPPWSASPHHCARDEPSGPPTVVLRAGEALLIPAGYYHAVASAPATCAINWWWPVSARRPCRRAAAAAAYLRRAPVGPRQTYLGRRALVAAAARAVRDALGGVGGADAEIRSAFKAGAGPLAAALAAAPLALGAATPRTCAALYALWEAAGGDALLDGAPGGRDAAVARLRAGRDAFSRRAYGRLARRLLRRYRPP